MKMIQLRRFFGVKGGTTPSTNVFQYWGGNIPWVTPADIQDQDVCHITNSKNKITEKGLSENGLILSEPGWIVFSSRAPIGKVGVCDVPLCTNQGCKLIYPLQKNVYDLDLLSFWLFSKKEELNRLGSGTTFKEISTSSLLSFQIPLIEKSAQRNISKFVKRKIEKINQTIKIQEKKLEKLSEYRQSLITQAVTKGLDPNAEMKESGIAWIGEIPLKWKVSKLWRHLKDIGSGTTPKDKTVFQYESTRSIAWLNTGDLNDGLIVSIPKKIKLSSLSEVPLKIYPRGSVVIAMYGATIGKLGILSFQSTTNQACCVLSPSSEINNVYLFYYLRMARAYLLQLGRGAGQPNISQELIGHLPFIVPPLRTQREIVDFLNEKCSSIDTITEKIQNSIEKLKEYRSSLITAAVTGKLNIEEVKYDE